MSAGPSDGRAPGSGRGMAGGHGPGGGPQMQTDFRKPKDTKRTLRTLLGRMSVYKRGFALVALCAVLSTALSTLGPYILGLSTNEIADGFARMLGGDGGIDFAALARILLVLGGVYALSSLLSYLQMYVMAGVSQGIMYRLRRDIDEKLRRLPLRYFDGNTLGDILSRVTNDVDTVSQTLQQGLPQIFSALLTLILVFGAMLLLSPLLTLIGLITFPAAFFFSVKVMQFSQGNFRGQQKGQGDISGLVEEMYTGHNVIKAFGREEEVVAEFDRLNETLHTHAWKAQFISGVIMPANMFFSNVGYVLVAVIGGISAAQGRMKVGTIQTFIQYLRQFNQPIQQITTISNQLQSTIAAAERVFAFLDEAEEPADTANPLSLENPHGDVSFEHVRFAYSEERVLMRNLSIELRHGDKIAIVGPTGAGKTTLVNLLLRFYDIQSGRITIDGVDIMRMKRQDLRSLFGMVLQDTWLFSGTIEENIRYGKLTATDEEVRAAARTAYADSFIRALPGGYHMQLGEDAQNISQGQRQLLTIARAVLSDPVILILDEATSSVDTRTELLIQQAMRRLMQNRTSFVIAHRLSTIRDAQMILVMDGGSIVETGTHEELLAKGGFYANLYNSQFAQAASAGPLGKAPEREYFLTTPRLGFSRWSGADAALAVSLWGDPEVSRHISGTGTFSREQCLARLEAEIQTQELFGFQYWPLFLRESGAFVGCCGLRPYRREESILEFGIHLLPSCWGKGYAAEAGGAVLGYALEELGAANVFAGHHPENAASRRMLLKLGFRYARDEYFAPTGLRHPSYLLK